MGEEIEVKYLLRENGQNHSAEALFLLYPSLSELEEAVREQGIVILQGYLPFVVGYQITERLNKNFDFEPKEARLRNKGGRFYFTLKGGGNLSRSELECEIDQKLFDDFWDSTVGKRVEKIRLDVPYEGHTAEIDVYTDRDLIVAEVEVPSLAVTKILPPLGLDISKDQKYKNKNLAK